MDCGFRAYNHACLIAILSVSGLNATAEGLFPSRDTDLSWRTAMAGDLPSLEDEGL